LFGKRILHNEKRTRTLPERLDRLATIRLKKSTLEIKNGLISEAINNIAVEIFEKNEFPNQSSIVSILYTS